MNKLSIFLVIILILGVFATYDALYIVDETEQAIITQFGRYIKTIKEPGLYIKTPFIQNLIYFEDRILAYDARPDRYYTGDAKRVIVDHITRWRIENPKEFYRSIRTEDVAIARLSDMIPGRLREEVGRHDFLDLVREKRDEIVDTVSKEVNEAAQDYGITIVDTRIKRLDLPSEVEQSVFERMEAERERMAMRYRAEGEEQAEEIKAEADKREEIILAEAYEKQETLRGEGDAAATEIYADAYERDPDFYTFLESLKTYEKFVPGSRLILRTDSELLQFITSPNIDLETIEE